ncbi:hypothetical protein PV08_04901 [Exophiala spinifera]|uniref:F-box domain-containing protein n=1 Tax=Exophiala spinifera TaxID=91928 RepID=A0A0D1YR28_9EURO|nr:uncharacterized protein PV08_04901 [Exophiala spinifera]KIW17706.1 hypothetical protein PV08_04901 [Exophiala spinifera]
MFLTVQDPTQQWVHASSFTLSEITSSSLRRPYFMMPIWDLNHSAFASARKYTHTGFEPEDCDLCTPEQSTPSSLRTHEQHERLFGIQKDSRKIIALDGTSEDPDDMPFLTSQRTSNSLTPMQPSNQQSPVQSPPGEGLRLQRDSVDHSGAFLNPFDEAIDSSRRTSTSSNTSIYLRPNAFPGHRDTLARLPRLAFGYNHQENVPPLGVLSDATCQTPSFPSKFTVDPALPRSGFLPPSVVSGILRFLSSEDYKALRLVCRLWNTALPSPKLPVVVRLPREILQHIYSYLLPCGFDAARHTCREWYLASLNRSVQGQIAKVSFCQFALSVDMQLLSGLEDSGCGINQEWVYSKRLATESRISPDWRGGPPLTNTTEMSSRLSITEEVDFSEMFHGACSGRSRFTVSTCGNFVLAVSSEEITVYDLHAPGGSVFPITRLAAGREVLKVSMDTSSERYSVVALLSGRLGMLWDLLGTPSKMHYRNSPGETFDLGMQTIVQDSATYLGTQPAMLNLRDISYIVSEARYDPARALSTFGATTGSPSAPSS